MSDRGFSPDASMACPFVAFEDDRDGRSTRPDHRHRCYAELRPAPRATAHQEAYCLSAGFAACPTFVDWARREAARVRPTADPALDAAAHPTAHEASPLGDDRRDWTSPPPWTEGAAGAAAVAAAMHGEEPGTPRAAGSLEPADTGPASTIEAPSFLASRTVESSLPVPPRGAESPAAAVPGPAPRARPAYPPADLDDELEAHAADDEGWAESDGEEPPMRRFGPAAGRSRYDDTHTAAAPPRRRPPVDADAPSWEKPRRYEAYPTLRTRTALAGVSPLLAAGIIIVLAAVALFFIPSFLLGLGGDGKATPTPSGSGAAASASADTSPSTSPAPTPFTYTVKSGDTLSGIAKQFSVSIDDIIAANPSLEDPDKLGIGDKLVIPIGGLQPSPSPSPLGASPSP